MNLTESANQQAFDKSQAQQQKSAQWLKAQAKTVCQPVLLTAIAGIGNGLGVIVQAALLALLLHRVVIEHAQLEQLVLHLWALSAVIVWRCICSYFFRICSFSAGAQITQQVQKSLFEKLFLLGPAYSRQQQSGELSTVIIEHVDALHNYFSGFLPQQIIVSVLPLLIVAAVLPVNWVVAVIFIVTGPLIPIFMALIGMGAASANRNQFLALSRMGGYFLDQLLGITTLKLFGHAERRLKSISQVAETFRQHTMSVLRIAFLSSAVLEFFSAVAVALVAVYVGLGLLGLVQFGPAGDITLQEALFVLILAPEFFLPLRQLATYYHDKAAALGAADAILTILQTAETEITATGPLLQYSHSVIVFCQVSKHFGPRVALHKIDLNIFQGEKVALIGTSGAGKTTLLNLLLGFEAATEGAIFLTGKPLNRQQADQQIAWLGQNSKMFCGSILENIAMANPQVNEQDILQAAKAAGVLDFSETLPSGIHNRVGERGYGLSGGQVQRIALARAFLKQAPIILLDEPTANLDLSAGMRLLDDIEQLFADRTMIIATHNQQVINRMHRQIILQQGKLVSV